MRTHPRNLVQSILDCLRDRIDLRQTASFRDATASNGAVGEMIHRSSPSVKLGQADRASRIHHKAPHGISVAVHCHTMRGQSSTSTECCRALGTMMSGNHNIVSRRSVHVARQQSNRSDTELPQQPIPMRRKLDEQQFPLLRMNRRTGKIRKRGWQCLVQTTEITRQGAEQIIARHLGKSNYDWRSVAKKPNDEHE